MSNISWNKDINFIRSRAVVMLIGFLFYMLWMPFYCLGQAGYSFYKEYKWSIHDAYSEIEVSDWKFIFKSIILGKRMQGEKDE